MKKCNPRTKFIIAAMLLIGCLFVNTSKAQNPMPVTTVSYTNTGADTATIKAVGAYNIVSIQPVVTKISGTVAGTVVLYGSLDGINYVSTGDTLANTNITTNTTIWFVQPSKYLYYRARAVGVGTMAASFKCWFLGRQ